jgi:hypothetical protein
VFGEAGLGGGLIQAGSPLRMRWCSSRGSAPGPAPSSSPSTRRACWQAASASAWRPATVRRVGDRQFMVSFTAPARAEVTLRTHATDAAGGSIAETIQNAYRS